MTFKTVILTATALVLAAGANAQTPAGASADADVKANTALGSVAGTVDAATDAQPAAKSDVVAVTEADVKTGAVVHDSSGAEVGKVESVNAEGVVIATGKSRVQIPLASVGKSSHGLTIAMTKAELDAAAAAKKPQS